MPQVTAITVTCKIISITVFPSVNEGTGLSNYLLITIKKIKEMKKLLFTEAVSKTLFTIKMLLHSVANEYIFEIRQ